MPNWETMPLTQLMTAVDGSHQQNKYVLIHDKQGNVPLFFQYQKMLFDFGPHLVKQAMSSQTSEETIEALRATMVHAWRSGQTLGINCKKEKYSLISGATRRSCPLQPCLIGRKAASTKTTSLLRGLMRGTDSTVTSTICSLCRIRFKLRLFHSLRMKSNKFMTTCLTIANSGVS